MAAHDANSHEPSWLPNNMDISPVKRLIEDCLHEVEIGYLDSLPSESLIASESHKVTEPNGYYKKVKLGKRTNGKGCWDGLYISKTLTKLCQLPNPPTLLNGYHNSNKFSPFLPLANVANESHFPGFFNQSHGTMLNLKSAASGSKPIDMIKVVYDGRGRHSTHLLAITRSLHPLPASCIESPNSKLVYAWLMGASGGLFGLNHFRDETTLDALTRDRLDILLSSTTSCGSQLVTTTAVRAADLPQVFTIKKGLGIDSIIGKIWSSKRLLNQQSFSAAPLVTTTTIAPAPNGRYHRKTFLPKRHYKGKPPPKASGKGWVRVLVPVDSNLSVGQVVGKTCDTPKGGTPSQYETRSFKRLKDQQNNKDFVPNFALESVELGTSLDTLSTVGPSSANASCSRGNSYDDVIESVIAKLCHNGNNKASPAFKKKAVKLESNAASGSVIVKTEPNDLTNSDISKSTPTPKVNEVVNPQPSPDSIIPSRRTAKEEIPHFEHIDENIYAYEEEKSTDKSARKQAKRMICNCEPPVDSLSRDKADEKDVAMAITTATTKDPALTAKVASLVSAIFTPKSGGCGPDCLNRLLMIECSNRCPCGDLCTNKQFQKRIYAQLEPFMTFTKGWGLRTLQDIEAGKFVIEYVGEVIDSKEFNKRQKHYHKDKRIHYYFMSLKQGQIIDATNKGSYSRFINHSCDPNCETQKWTVNGKLRIGIFAKRRIPKYSELTFDYQSQRYGREPQKCYCGSFNCRGYIDKNYLPTAAILPTPLPPDHPTDECHANGNSLSHGSPSSISPSGDDPWLAQEMADMLAQLDVHDQNGTGPSGGSGSSVTVEGMTDSKQIIRFCRLMVRTEKLELQRKLLQVLKLTRKDLLNIFINLQGLNLLWTWMTTLTNAPHDLEFKLELLDTLAVLPIQNRDTLERSKLPRIVEKWAIKPEYSRETEFNHESGMHREIALKSQNLIEKWKDIKDVYKIPKKRDTNGYESGASPYQPSPQQINGTGQSLSEQHKVSRDEFDRGTMEKSCKVNGNNGDPLPYPYESSRRTPTLSQNYHPEDLRRTLVEESKYYPSPSHTNLPYQGTTTPQREHRGERLNNSLSTSSFQCSHVNHLTPSPASLPKINDSSAERDVRYDAHKTDHTRHRSSRDHRRESSHSSRHGSSYRGLRDEKGHHNHHWSHHGNHRYNDDKHGERDRRDRGYYRDDNSRRSSKRREDEYDYAGRSKRTHSDASEVNHKDRTTATPTCVATDPRDRFSRQQTTIPTTPLITATFNSPVAASNSAKSQARNSGTLLSGLSPAVYPPLTVFSPNFAQLPTRPSFPSFYGAQTSGSFLPFNVLDPSAAAANASGPNSHALYNMPPLARNLFMPTVVPPSSSLGLLGSTYHHHQHSQLAQHYSNHSGGGINDMISPPPTQLQMPYFIPNLNSQHQPSPIMPMNGSLLESLTTPQTINQPLETKKVKVASQKLPKDWKTAIDASTGKPYYYHKITKQVQWDRPICNESDPEEQSSSTESSSNSSPHSNTSPVENQEFAGTDIKDRHQDSAKIKEKFRQELSAYVIQCLGPYHKKSCKVGRINSSEDFKYLARKLTHTVMAKELERNGSSIESLRLSTKMKAKTELYIEKYMEKLGPNFVRPSHS